MKKKAGRAVHGLVVVDKPVGLSSNHALQRVKRLFNAKKAGHTGTLDPLASGVLVVCLGKATKVAQYIVGASKAYRVTAKLGVSTDSGDSEGEIISTRNVSDEQKRNLGSILKHYVGEIEQVPPMFSALKHQGQPLYKLARQGVEVERAARKVNIRRLDLLGMQDDAVELEVHCSKGTYIRSLIMDIGDELGCGAHVTQLRRTQVGEFGARYAMHTLEMLEGLAQQGQKVLDQAILKTEKAFSSYSRVELCQGFIEILQQGGKCRLQGVSGDKLVTIYDTNGVLHGFGEVDTDQFVRFHKIYKH